LGFILSNLLSHKEETGDSHGAELLKQISSVSWQHINENLVELCP
jgi:hypothetical protein